MHPDGRSFYFSSKGHNSMGGYDVFKSTYDKGLDVFGAPVNMDFAVNTPDATLEVFDLAGRRIAQRTMQPTAAGTTMEVEAGSGTRFAPGAYFVRLSQGRAKPVSKMVLVAK